MARIYLYGTEKNVTKTFSLKVLLSYIEILVLFYNLTHKVSEIIDLLFISSGVYW